MLPPGYYHLRRRAIIGSGAAVFAVAAKMLFSWQVQLRAGLRVSPSSAIAEPGAVVVLGREQGQSGPARRPGPSTSTNQPESPGSAYGTLPGTSRARRGTVHRRAARRWCCHLCHHRILQAGDAAGSPPRPAGTSSDDITMRYRAACSTLKTIRPRRDGYDPVRGGWHGGHGPQPGWSRNACSTPGPGRPGQGGGRSGRGCRRRPSRCTPRLPRASGYTAPTWGRRCPWSTRRASSAS